MRLIESYFTQLHVPYYQDALRVVEAAARTCYQSEPRADSIGAKEAFVRRLIKSGHLAMLEHVSMSLRLIVDRGVSHELVRHRLAAYAQESTRYVKYDGDMEFIIPTWYPTDYEEAILDSALYRRCATFENACKDSESAYKVMLDAGATPQEARAVLNNATKTEIVITANFREWRHIFELRALGTTGKPHPDMQEIMMKVFKWAVEEYPVFFDDLVPQSNDVKKGGDK